jgi:hypothetical protein
VQITLATIVATSIAAYKYREKIAEKLKKLKQRFVKSASRKA